MNPLKKLDWNVTDEPDLISMSQALFGGPLTGQTAPVPPPGRWHWLDTGCKYSLGPHACFCYDLAATKRRGLAMLTVKE